MPRDNQKKVKDIQLTGKMITSTNGVFIGENFSELSNLRYNNFGLEGVGGMSKINSTALSTYPKMLNGFHFMKDQPSESHILVQAWNSGLTSSVVYQNETAIPGTGDFNTTIVHTDASGSSIGRFSTSPNGELAYCNGKESLMWGGDEFRVTKFTNYNPDESFSYDFTAEVNNTLNDTDNIATLIDTGSSCYMYVGSLWPISGFKYYMETVNASTSTLDVEYWDGSAWVSVTTLVDGTSSGGVSLAQTGTVTFDDTSASSMASIINQTYIFWFKVIVTVVDTGTTLSQVTTKSEVQKIQDIWDGAFRAILKFYRYDGSTLIDNSANVFSEDFSVTNEATYSNIGSQTTTEYVYAGFPERLAGLNVVLGDIKVNSLPATLDVQYWNGSGWVSVDGLVDGTFENTKSFTRTGTISWQAPSSSSEFKQEISKEIPLYFYKLIFSAAISGNVYVDFLSGIPAQEIISGYGFPMNAQDRLWLCSDKSGSKNKAICSARGTSVVFNGEDSIPIHFGDTTELMAATNLYSQFSSSLYDLMVFCKKHETWLVSGSGPSDWTKFLASDKIGCIAPLTMVRAHVGIETVPGANRYIAIWQADNGIYIFDGRNFHPVHSDIDDLFDKKNSDGLNTDVIEKSTGYYDDYNNEYHWLCATGTSTTLNREFVYDLRRQKWFEIDRGSGKRLQVALTVQDTIGNKYTYGSIDTGYIERLENGTTFDGDDMVHVFTIGDLNLTNSLSVSSTVRGVRLVGGVKNITSSKVSLDHYIDGESIARKSFNDLNVGDTGASVTYSKKDLGGRYGIHHSLSFSLTTDDEIYGFEPYVISLVYKIKGLDIS